MLMPLVFALSGAVTFSRQVTSRWSRGLAKKNQAWTNQFTGIHDRNLHL